MALDPDLVRDMRDTVTVIAPGTRDMYGDETGGLEREVRCRISRRTRRQYDVGGRVVAEKGQITFAEPVGFTDGWRVRLENGDVPQILHVERIPDETGFILEVVHLG